MAEIRVPFFDTDAMGVVHHANHFRYFEVARIHHLRARGVNYKDWTDKGFHLPLVESHCRYRRPARFEDLLEVSVKVSRQGVRFVFDYEMINKNTGELVATGYTHHVPVNDELKVIEPPQDLLDAMTKGENHG
ncbi:MAG: acyl-CoA thioesterase [Oligoflexia bacterium]|nr:acyl-CoA thioesterase [Oligoflexia bacterium]